MASFVRALALLPLAFLMAATAEVSIADYELMGSCTFQYQWTGETCMEFRGTSWTVDSMSKRCDAESDGVWSPEACGASEDLAGFCIMTNVNDNDNAIEATAMMITPASDCAFNKMACENFMSGSFESMQSCSSGEEGMTQTEVATETETTSASTKPNCDESLTAPVKLPCPATPQIMVSYDESTIDCGEALSVEDAASVPTVRVVADIEDESVYSLLLVDTSESPVHPILHYGALNIQGSLLKEGFVLDNKNVTIFSSYRGPNPPKPDEMWSTPQTQQTLFVYEYMLSKQPNGLMSGGDLLGMSTMSFDYEAFFEETIGSSFDESNIMSTYFRSGRCNFDNDKETASSNDILIDSFDNPQFLWESVMVDNMANGGGGNWDRDSSLTWNFTGYNKTEFSEINNYEQETFEMDMMGFREEYYDTIRGSKMEIVDDTLVFTANISSDTFDMMGSSMMMGGSTVNMVAMNARGVFPDLRSCDGLKIVAKQQQQTNSGSSSEQPKNDYYDGFKIDIGYTKFEGSVFGYGYRASLNMMGLEDEDVISSNVNVARASSLSSDIDNDGFQTVIIPFEDFTVDWDWNTGEVVTSCQEDEQYCIDEQTLKDMETFTITALGSTNGVAQELHIQSIAGTGCDDSAISASSVTEGVNKDDQWTCSSIGSSQSDEILIETFTDPSFGWITQNDPVMGGESYSSVTMMEDDGAAFFTGEIKDVPFLGGRFYVHIEWIDAVLVSVKSLFPFL